MANYLTKSTFDPTSAETLFSGLTPNSHRTVGDQIQSPDGRDYLQLVAEIRKLQSVAIDHESRIAAVE